MPCLAKKYEASRHKFKDGGIPDVDYSISTRQIASLLKQANIDLRTLPESKFDKQEELLKLQQELFTNL